MGHFNCIGKKFSKKRKKKIAAKQKTAQIAMSLRLLFLFFGVAHSFTLLSKDLQGIVNLKLMPSDLVKMKAVDPNWRGAADLRAALEIAKRNGFLEAIKILKWSQRMPLMKIREYTNGATLNKARTRGKAKIFSVE